MQSLLSQGRSVQKVKSIFSEKTWNETPWWEEHLCTEESLLQEHVWGAAAGEQPFGRCLSPCVSHKLNVVLVVYLSDLPQLMPAFPNSLPSQQLPPTLKFRLPLLDSSSGISSGVALKFATGRLTTSFWRSVQDMSWCVAVAEKQQIQRYMLYSSLQNQARRVWGVGWSLYM